MLGRTRFLPLVARCGVVGMLAVGGVAVPGTAALAQGTAEGWDPARGPAWTVQTDRMYNGERALRIDYDFVDISENTALFTRDMRVYGVTDWTSFHALRFAIDGDGSKYALSVQLQDGAGRLMTTPLITLGTSGWTVVDVPFHRFDCASGNASGFNWGNVISERIVIRFHGGDFDPHTVYFGGWQRTTSSHTELPDPSSVPTTTYTRGVGNAQVDIVVGDSDGLLYGLGAARQGGTQVRTGALAHLVRPVVYDTAGRVYEAFQFDDVVTNPDGSVVVSATAVDGGHQLRWVFAPEGWTLSGRAFDGFRYHYQMVAASGSGVYFDRIDEAATWELGGSSAGNTAVLRGAEYATEVSGAATSAFDTRQDGCSPTRFSNAGAFEYQAGSLGQLLVSYDRADLIEGSFVKQSGATVFEHLDSYRLPRRQDVTTPDKVVLRSPGDFSDPTALLNEHTTIRDAVFERFRGQYGITHPPVVPSVTFPRRPLDDYTTLGWLDEAARLGFKTVNFGPTWNSDTENNGPSGVPGIPVWTFDIADRWGDDTPGSGNAALGRLITEAGNRGLKVRTWAPTAHMSRNAPIMVNHPSWVVRSRYGAIDGAYWSLAGIDMNDPDARASIYNGLATRHVENGLEALWLDTFHTFGMKWFDYGNAIPRPHVEQTLAHINNLQDLGYDIHVEGYGPFGMTSSGYNADRTKYYDGFEYRAYDTALLFSIPPTDIDYYKFAANKAMPFTGWSASLWNDLPGNTDLGLKVKKANHDFNEVAQYMVKRVLLADDRGVVWHSAAANPTHTALFTFTAFEYTLPGDVQQVIDVTTGEQVPITGPALSTQARHTYLIVRG